MLNENIFPLMQPGDLLVASNRLYGGSITQLGKTIKKFDWSTEFVDVDNLDAVHIRKSQSTRLKTKPTYTKLNQLGCRTHSPKFSLSIYI